MTPMIGSPARPVRLGTRASLLAVTQSAQVARELRERGLHVDLVPITTEGDTSRASLTQQSNIGVFAAALREALLEDRCDLAVHSAKDLPARPVEGLTVAAYPQRASAQDTLVLAPDLRPDANVSTLEALAHLPAGARVGTGSPRRAAQLKALRPDLHLVDIRGNVPTRLARVRGLTGLLLQRIGSLLGEQGTEQPPQLDTNTQKQNQRQNLGEKSRSASVYQAETAGESPAGHAPQTPAEPLKNRENAPLSGPETDRVLLTKAWAAARASVEKTVPDLDAVILAAAGLNRLGWADLANLPFPTDALTPAAAQGALALEVRQSDLGSESGKLLTSTLHFLDDPATRVPVMAERSVLGYLEAGCSAPIGVFGTIPGWQKPSLASTFAGTLTLVAKVISLDGKEQVECSANTTMLWAVDPSEREWAAAAAEELGVELAEELLRCGAAQTADLKAGRASHDAPGRPGLGENNPDRHNETENTQDSKNLKHTDENLNRARTSTQAPSAHDEQNLWGTQIGTGDDTTN